ncbi:MULTISPECIES: 2,4'-dihydroxyacetophenone dioxygenase family protein [unclassified Pseudomonas]|uniref:2,4'-dihydroxyacetophenone dioxygenase family protein n=1 Tax=unclassified Pseudomonas TaxID=196821 RepID=UPI002448C02F|nr:MULTISPECIES: 2,4'-dihydroxyacetophenone dioxygenase family protein [unclassified Pseudomonas]MDG9924425.1 2,4'-dihydroxyacetophenone dioxygenase family protein [Pseudomonas sp. GD04045]MDH0035235.1 2,4'-dihydroxyacetophenone dioxygenase family protein [Pseudomonas sp. GD04019]
MLYESIDTAAINDEDLPWVPFAPYSNEVFVKYIKCDPVRGETITLLKSPAGVTMPKHHHSGTVIVYTIKGAWKYLEHDWISKQGGVVFETAGTSHTPMALAEYGDEIITLNIVQGDLLYFDENDNLFAIENWKSGVERYLAYCKANGIEAKDITSFSV